MFWSVLVALAAESYPHYPPFKIHPPDPLPFPKEGGRIFKRGVSPSSQATPLKLKLPDIVIVVGRRQQGEIEGAPAPSSFSSPSLCQREGDTGDRVIKSYKGKVVRRQFRLKYG
jgi:hypothetical protein